MARSQILKSHTLVGAALLTGCLMVAGLACEPSVALAQSTIYLDCDIDSACAYGHCERARQTAEIKLDQKLFYFWNKTYTLTITSTKYEGHAVMNASDIAKGYDDTVIIDRFTGHILGITAQNDKPFLTQEGTCKRMQDRPKF